MAETATLARPYAEAVFGLADQAGTLAPWSRALAAMAQVAAHPQVQVCIANPNIDAERLYGLFVSLCPAEFSTEARNFVRLLIANDRLPLLPQIHVQFARLKNEREGVVDSEIRTAFPMDDAQLKSLVTDLERRFRRKMQPRVTVDRELIGGVRVAVGDEVIDGSVRGRLDEMAAAFKS